VTPKLQNLSIHGSCEVAEDIRLDSWNHIEEIVLEHVLFQEWKNLELFLSPFTLRKITLESVGIITPLVGIRRPGVMLLAALVR
jgi:hypothetical protein